MELQETQVKEEVANNENSFIDIISGDYGPVYVGIVGIVAITALGYLAKGKMKLNVSLNDLGVNINPV